MLYLSGKTGKLGRVDNRDAYLDTFELERERGITIFSKQAVFEYGGTEFTLLDTPGHVDFSAEMERTLRVLDYAILVVSGADGVQAHTRTLWRLLALYRIPVFIFVNKMDQNGTDRESLLKELKDQLGDGCIDFEEYGSEAFYDGMAMCGESLMETYLAEGKISEEKIREEIRYRRVFPCYFGSALRLDGVERLLDGLIEHGTIPRYQGEFGARVFKITRDEQGNRLVHMKLTGGRLKIRDVLKGDGWEEKVTQIRIYSGQKYEAVSELSAGAVCAVTGLTGAGAGEGLGIEEEAAKPQLEPVLFYRMVLPPGCDPKLMLPKLQQLEEELPELHIVWDAQLQEIQVRIMGDVQLEILQSQINDRYGAMVSFDEGGILYKETIANIAYGVGHFEPLRHYAEVHLLLTPGERGSGLVFDTECSEDILARSWQHLVLHHLEEKIHRGVLTRSPITDMRITLMAGRAHNKHTEGGDFREATWRAVRQGLMEAESVLLEPYYAFQLELPEKMIGRAMTDIDKMGGACEISSKDGEMAILTGSAPVSRMRNYQREVTAYSRGMGRLFCTLKGYEPCIQAEEVIDRIGYVPELDAANPSGSVFCAQGSGFVVDWYEVKNHMHLESVWINRPIPKEQTGDGKQWGAGSAGDRWISPEEVDQILNRSVYANQGKKSDSRIQIPARESIYRSTLDTVKLRPQVTKEEYLLVDGYNIIFAWPELSELAKDSLESARIKLLDILCNYQGIRKCTIIAVFDAYRVQGHRESITDYHNIHTVFTREAQTADQYIEKFAHDNQKKYNIVVATSDGLQQIIVRGAGCLLMSARELGIEIEETVKQLSKDQLQKQGSTRNFLSDALTEEAKEKMDRMTGRSKKK